MPRTCANCGRVIPPDQANCDCANAPRPDWLHSSQTILLATLVLLISAFAVTALAAGLYHDRRRALAEFWLHTGTRDLHDGRASAALSDLQTALIYARQDVPDSQQEAYSLNLAQALVASHRLDEADSYLLDLSQRAPESASLNLALARLSVERGDDSSAKRYYANAIYGIWEGNAEQVQQSQRDTQLEFCRYLIGRNDATEAQSVLLAISASLPPDPALAIQVGQMMLSVGADRQALIEFQRALELDRRNHAALVGAGLASFALGDDRVVVRYLGQASREKPQPEQSETLDPAAARALAVSTADLELDAFRPGLTTDERARRSAQSYVAAEARMEDCAKKQGILLPKPAVAGSRPSTPPQASQNTAPSDVLDVYAQAAKLGSSTREADLARNPQLIDSLGKVVVEMESVATAHCGPPTEVEDEALARIAQRAAGTQP